MSNCINDFIAGGRFRYFWFPIGTCLFAVWIKLITRTDGAIRQDDFAVGPDLQRSAVLMLVALTCQRAVDLEATYCGLDTVSDPVERVKLLAHIRELDSSVAWSGIAIFATCVLLFGTADFVRRWGWESDPKNPENPTNLGNRRLRIFWGVILPILLGLASLELVARFLSS